MLAQRLAIVGFAIAGLAGGHSVAADDIGEQEYMTYCASCHGADGTGDGPLAAFLTVKVPDLTVVAQEMMETFYSKRLCAWWTVGRG